MSEARWETCKQVDADCPGCGHRDRCKIAPKRDAYICRRGTNKVVQMKPSGNGHNGSGTGYVGQAHRKPHVNGNGANGHHRSPDPPVNPRGRPKTFKTVNDAIEAVVAQLSGSVLSKTCHYRHADGSDAFIVVRLDLPDGGKEFRPVSPAKGGGWKVGGAPDPLPLYRLVDVLATHRLNLGQCEPTTVYVTEGEKTCDAGWSIGLVATTSAHGSASAGKSDWTSLAGHDVVILPDNDEPGAKYARAVATILVKLDPPARVRIVQLPDLPPGGDIVEYIEAAGDAMEPADIGAAVVELADATAPVDPADLIGGPVLVFASDVEAVRVEWLWHKRLPMGRTSLLVGSPGVGKSYVTCDMAARITTGTPWPDGAPCEAGSVLFVTAEDDMADTIRPRLDACGADPTRVAQLAAVRRVDEDTGKPRDVMFTLADVPALEAALRRLPDCRLVVIDPIGSFLGGDVDAHRDNEVRAVLGPVGMLAAKHGVAVLIVAHRRKGNSGSADETALGSRAFTGLVRAVWHLGADASDPTGDRRLLLPGKISLARKPDGLAFALRGEPVAGVVWESGPVLMTADDAMHAERKAEAKGVDEERGADSEPSSESDALAEAVEWLRAELADLAEHQVSQLKRATADAGLAWRTMQRARQSLRAIVHRATFGGGYIWRLPKPGEPAPETLTPDPDPD